MKLTVLGTGSPLPIPHRVQSGYLLEKNDRLLLVDCGSGVYAQLINLEVDWARLDTFMLTHHHLDHVSDLLTILTARWLLGFPESTVYGPEGTQQLIKKWVALFEYVDDAIKVESYDIEAGEPANIAGFEISSLAMRHFVTSLAYKFDHKLAICGDSDPVPELKSFADGCKLLIHECSYTDDQADFGHTNPTALAKTLDGVRLDELWLTHFYPNTADCSDEIVAAMRKHFHGKTVITQDLQQVEL